MSDVEVRRAEPDDAATIGAIYDDAIADGTATFATGPHTPEERRGWLTGRAATAPVFVADRDGEVLGWSAVAPFSHRSWYSGVGEYTVYVAAHSRGVGIGRTLLDRLVTDAPAFGYWKLVGLIFPENAPGLALAHGAGFRDVGRLEAHGRMNDEWRDIMLLERHLEID